MLLSSPARRPHPAISGCAQDPARDDRITSDTLLAPLTLLLQQETGTLPPPQPSRERTLSWRGAAALTDALAALPLRRLSSVASAGDSRKARVWDAAPAAAPQPHKRRTTALPPKRLSFLQLLSLRTQDLLRGGRDRAVFGWSGDSEQVFGLAPILVLLSQVLASHAKPLVSLLLVANHAVNANLLSLPLPLALFLYGAVDPRPTTRLADLLLRYVSLLLLLKLSYAWPIFCGSPALTLRTSVTTPDGDTAAVCLEPLVFSRDFEMTLPPRADHVRRVPPPQPPHTLPSLTRHLAASGLGAQEVRGCLLAPPGSRPHSRPLA